MSSGKQKIIKEDGVEKENSGGEMVEVLAALGYRGTGTGNAITYVRAPRRRARATPRHAAVSRHEANSPFAKLRGLAVSR